MSESIPKLLVLDENQERRAVLREAFNELGAIRLLVAPSVKSGIVALRKTPVDLLVVTSELAGRNGNALLRALRADAVLQHLPVVVLCGDCTGEEVSGMENAGASVCVGCPLDPDAMRSTIQQAMISKGIAPALAGKLSKPSQSGQAATGRTLPECSLNGTAQVACEESNTAPTSAIDPLDNYEDAKRLVALGVRLLSSRQIPKAVKAFSAALKRKATMPEAFLGLSQAFSKAGDSEKAYRFQHSAVASFVLNGRLAEAGKAGKRLRDMPADTTKALKNPYLLAGKQLAESGDAEAATRAFEAGLSAGLGDSGNLSKELAFAYCTLGKNKKAERVLRDAGMDASLLQNGHTGTSGINGAEQSRNPEAAEVAGAVFPDADGKKLRHSGSSIQVEEKPQGWKEKRQHPRVPLADFVALFSRLKPPLPVVDISLGGLCIKTEGRLFSQGDIIRFALLDQDGTRMKKVQAVVRFVAQDRMGCQFLELSGKQSAQLSELIRQEEAKQPRDEYGNILNSGDSLVRRDSNGKIIIDLDMM